MGARRSTGRVCARWFLFPTHTWEPLLLTRVVLGESDRRWQDGKIQLERRHGWHGTVVLCFFMPHIHGL